MPRYALLSIVLMMAFVMTFDQMRSRHRTERFAAVTGLWLFDRTSQKALSPSERANRLYSMGELAAAAEVIALTSIHSES